jgi:hypothetical protein
MLDSEVPLAPEAARADLLALLRDNLGREPQARDDLELVFHGWRALCERYAPLFVEKSPHHLHQWSALELLLECVEQAPDIAFLAVGLVRNPMDTLYSSWRRWGSAPEANQYEWLRAYRNLGRLAGRLGSRLVVRRYEDLVRDPARLDFLLEFAGVARPEGSGAFLHADSLGRWRRDAAFRLRLAAPVAALARELGYQAEELEAELDTRASR